MLNVFDRHVRPAVQQRSGFTSQNQELHRPRTGAPTNLVRHELGHSLAAPALTTNVKAAFKAFEEGFAAGVGRPGRAYDASLRARQIYSVVPRDASKGYDKLLTAHEIEGTRLLVTRFRNERLRQGQTVQLHTRAAWWTALRQITDFIIVDTPSIDRASTRSYAHPG